MSTRALHRMLLLIALGCGVVLAPLSFAGRVAAQDDTDFADEEEASDEADEEEPSDESDEAADEEEGDTPELEDASPPPEGVASVRFQAFVGGGMGTRALRRPLKGMGVQRMDDVPFPALDAGLRVTAWPSESFSLEFLLRYLTSLGMSIEQQPRFALANTVDTRAQSIELTVAPEWKLGDSPGSSSVLFPIGFGLRTLWPEVHDLPVPGYTLGGPLLRAELALRFLDVVTLRLGPEAQWIVMIDRLIKDDGVGTQGVALGGEALLQIQFSTAIGIEFAFRESHAIAPTNVSGESFVDIERFVIGRVSGTW